MHLWVFIVYAGRCVNKGLQHTKTFHVSLFWQILAIFTQKLFSSFFLLFFLAFSFSVRVLMSVKRWICWIGHKVIFQVMKNQILTVCMFFTPITHMDIYRKSYIGFHLLSSPPFSLVTWTYHTQGLACIHNGQSTRMEQDGYAFTMGHGWKALCSCVWIHHIWPLMTLKGQFQCHAF